ncbi:Fic/DOC family protein [Citrobacter enshiensis]|uniref:Fic/DOC family protein n=1 Tax=Citrobacter enshiensis TaxID=2971264 RepID=UPI0023E87FBF|nr:Fic family protein [Citrobacter enshiensis]WET41558.1 Fic family protein [Citrobacter enshiensis]
MSRYHVSGSEGLYEKNSGEQILANKLGITHSDEMDEAELVLLEQLYRFVFEEQFPQGQLTIALLKNWHRRWLGNIYEWAGQERAVNISKGSFMFAPSAQLPKLLHEFDTKYLARYTPCTDMSKEQLIEAIAVTHVELILIHPFREGNGRLSRLLADVMAVQGGYKPLDYQSWEQNKAKYISAIHAGMSMDYNPMCYWVKTALRSD